MQAIQGWMARTSAGGSPPVLEWACREACVDPVGLDLHVSVTGVSFGQHKLQRFVSVMHQELSWWVGVVNSAL